MTTQNNSVRLRSASPKSVSFSPQLTRKYSAERPLRAQQPALAPPAASWKLYAPGFDWQAHYHDFSAYLDALLADLQNSISPVGGRGNSPATPGYGSINGARSGSSHGYHSPKSPTSPTYQNQSFTQEKIIPVTKQYESHQSPNSGSLGRSNLKPVHNNLSELDSLLQDLSNAKYTGFSERPGSADRSGYSDRSYASKTDGYGKTNGAISPSSSLGRSTSDTLHRPTVDSLLDQLSSDISNGTNPGRQSPKPGAQTKHVKVTVEETVVEPVTGSQPHKHTHVHPVTHTHASNATRELDDLMASLSDFKVSQGGGTGGTHHSLVTSAQGNISPRQHVYKATHAWQETSRYQTSQPDGNLESMLGSLRADMSRQGVQTTQKGCCNACDKPIVGQVITALGRTWHPEHFTCAHCSQELGTRNFFERDGKPYCEPDYHNLFSPRCAYCNGPILDKCVTALEKTWHTEHFFCAQCGQQFGEDGFHERDGKPYCRNDYFDMFAPKCGGCRRPIMENYISALNSQWHPTCFVCRDCNQPFLGGSFFDHEGQPYCETHYHAKRGSLCAGCHKPIAGRCITAMFRKFHPEHFVCAFCLKQLNKGTFKEQHEKPYCHTCFEKLFG